MRLLRVGQVAEMLGTSTWWVWDASKNDPTFPKYFKISEKTAVWDEADVEAWVLAKKELYHGSQREEGAECVAVQPTCCGTE